MRRPASLRSSPGGRKRRAFVTLIAALALVAVVVVGLSQAGGKTGDDGAAARPFDLRAALAKLDGAPKPLAALHGEANRLLGGGKAALNTRLRALRGHPVVINKWASWCSPCRAEFPVFQQVATDRGRRVAFLGLDAQDKAPAAKRFLAARPLPYPSYEDPDQSVSRSLEAPDVAPVTVFLDARGKTAFIHSGQYTSVRQLTGDIDRYLKR
jgi:cytochrome c biogenesis protein CcmG, thiol:disulfide interchange protein DsbE